MNIKFGKKTIAVEKLFRVLFYLNFIATMGFVLINFMNGKNLITWVVLLSAMATGVCYYFSVRKEMKE